MCQGVSVILIECFVRVFVVTVEIWWMSTPDLTKKQSETIAACFLLCILCPFIVHIETTLQKLFTVVSSVAMVQLVLCVTT